MAPLRPAELGTADGRRGRPARRGGAGREPARGRAARGRGTLPGRRRRHDLRARRHARSPRGWRRPTPPICAVPRAGDRPRPGWPRPCIATILRCMAIATPDVSVRARAAARQLAVAGRATEGRGARGDRAAHRAQRRRDLRGERGATSADARAAGTSAALIDRLTLDAPRVAALAAAVRSVALLADPVGEIVTGWRLPNGLDVQKVRIPLGVLLVVYEARPNVTADVAALAIKSGNACILRGSSSARRTNAVLIDAVRAGLEDAGAARRRRRRLRLQPRRAGRVRRRPEIVRRRDPARRRAAQGLPDQALARAGAGRRRRQLPRLPRRDGRSAEGARRSSSTRRPSGPACATRPRRCSSIARRCRCSRAIGVALRDAGVELRADADAAEALGVAEPAGDRRGLVDRVPRPRARGAHRRLGRGGGRPHRDATAPGTPRRSSRRTSARPTPSSAASARPACT